MSHWSVASVATVKLITGAFDELKNDPTIGLAVALRRAEMAMLDPKNPPEFAHPQSGRRSCSLAKVAREGKIDRSEMAIRGISAGAAPSVFARSTNGRLRRRADGRQLGPSRSELPLDVIRLFKKRPGHDKVMQRRASSWLAQSPRRVREDSVGSLFGDHVHR